MSKDLHEKPFDETTIAKLEIFGRPKARPMKPKWAASVRDQCDEQGVAFFFKQWGTWGEDGVKRSKKTNGRNLMGREWNEEPRVEEEELV